MKLIEPQHAYVRLWEALTGNRVPAAQALSLLDKKFSTPTPNQQPVYVTDAFTMQYYRCDPYHE